VLTLFSYWLRDRFYEAGFDDDVILGNGQLVLATGDFAKLSAVAATGLLGVLVFSLRAARELRMLRGMKVVATEEGEGKVGGCCCRRWRWCGRCWRRCSCMWAAAAACWLAAACGQRPAAAGQATAARPCPPGLHSPRACLALAPSTFAAPAPQEGAAARPHAAAAAVHAAPSPHPSPLTPHLSPLTPHPSPPWGPAPTTTTATLQVDTESIKAQLVQNMGLQSTLVYAFDGLREVASILAAGSSFFVTGNLAAPFLASVAVQTLLSGGWRRGHLPQQAHAWQPRRSGGCRAHSRARLACRRCRLCEPAFPAPSQPAALHPASSGYQRLGYWRMAKRRALLMERMEGARQRALQKLKQRVSARRGGCRPGAHACCGAGCLDA
jgi:hypothetical protein